MCKIREQNIRPLLWMPHDPRRDVIQMYERCIFQSLQLYKTFSSGHRVTRNAFIKAGITETWPLISLDYSHETVKPRHLRIILIPYEWVDSTLSYHVIDSTCHLKIWVCTHYIMKPPISETCGFPQCNGHVELRNAHVQCSFIKYWQEIKL